MSTICQEIRGTVSNLLNQGQVGASLKYLNENISRYPDEPTLLHLVGVICASIGQTEVAIKSFKENIKRFGDSFRDSYYELGKIYESRGLTDEAVEMWNHDLKDEERHSVALQAMLKSPTISSSTLFFEQRKWAERYAKVPFNVRDCSFEPFREDRVIRLGYACSFWNSDTMKHQLLPIIRRHDRSKFKVYAYSKYDVPGSIKTCVDEFRMVGDLNDAQFVALVRLDNIDVFVECTGFSQGNRFTAMASRCAPVQVSYLNHTGTSGVPNVDYIFADHISLREEEDLHYTEKVYRLPGCFFCFNFDDKPHPDPGPAPHLRNNYITFGCFGSGGKINDTLISWWCEILRRVPGSRIFIRNKELNPIDNRTFMEERFKSRGIPPQRLIIMEGAERDGIVDSYSAVDISLDTWPYSGGNTIAESLWQGVPVLTYRGRRFSSAYGSSLLTASGCAELVAESPEEYIEKAVQLARDREKIVWYRANLRKLTREYGFNDTVAFARKLEDAYFDMMRSTVKTLPVRKPLEQIEKAMQPGNEQFKMDLLDEGWSSNYARREYEPFNRFLFELSLKGLGINNSSSMEISGEDWLIRQLPELLEGIPAPTIFDVGAYNGEFSKRIANVLPSAAIHAFEPMREAYATLKDGLSGPQFRLNNVGLSDKTEGAVNMFSHRVPFGNLWEMHASLYRNVFEEYYHSDTYAYQVSMDTLDNYCSLNNVAHIDYLKIDTEGNDLNVLRGARNMIARMAITFVQFEFNYTTLFSRSFFKDFYNLLPMFAFFRLLPQGLLPLSPDDFAGNNIFNFQNIVAVNESYLHLVRPLVEPDETFLTSGESDTSVEAAPEVYKTAREDGNDCMEDIKQIFAEKSVGNIFDVGAHEGESAIAFGEAFPDAHIFSFEPSGETFPILLEKTKNLPNYSPVNCGLAEKPGPRLFHQSGHSCLNSFLPSGKEWPWKYHLLQPNVELQCQSLDVFCAREGINDIGILKIDVQGAEMFVLKGASDLLKSESIKCIIAEVLFMDLYEGQTSFVEIFNHLTGCGFNFTGLYNHFYDQSKRLRWCDALFAHSSLFQDNGNLVLP
jgi:FkbM family methyltransferase